MKIGTFNVFSQDTIFLKDFKTITKNRDSINYFKIISNNNNIYQYTIYNTDGSTNTKGNLKSINPEIKEGIEERFFRDGRTFTKGNFINSKQDGVWSYYHYLKDYIEYQKVFKDDKIIESLFYHDNGKIKRERVLTDRTGKKDKCFDENGNQIKCEEYVDEIMPKFNGDLSEYISDRIYYPSECRKKKIEGQVEVTFYIDIDGSVQNAHVTKSVHPSMDEQAKFIISGMPNWIPGQQREKYVRVYYTLPITFKLQ